MKFTLNNRIDVMDKMGKWLAGFVAEIYSDEATNVQTGIKVHFKGYKPKWDEVIDMTTKEGLRRIKEVGALTKEHGWAKTNDAY